MIGQALGSKEGPDGLVTRGIDDGADVFNPRSVVEGDGPQTLLRALGVADVGRVKLDVSLRGSF